MADLEATAADCELEIVRLAERLAIVDEINDDAGHELAIAAIQLALLARHSPETAAETVDIALVACHRSLEAMRRVRRMLDERAGGGGDSALIPEEVARLRLLAERSGAALRLTDAVPDGADLAVGLMLSALRTTEVLLRFSAHRHAVATIDSDGRALQVRVESELDQDEWGGPHPDLERLRERVRWFDGRLRVERAPGGSRVTAELLL